jgi:pimeloyl-ACP methyl ester carboxylesterase
VETSPDSRKIDRLEVSADVWRQTPESHSGGRRFEPVQLHHMSDVSLPANGENRDPLPNEKVAPAQITAMQKWGAPTKDPYAYLEKITQPALVVNGDNDVIIYTVNSCILQRNLPNAQLILYPDANHGSQYQYPELFVAHATLFLNGTSQLLSAIGRSAICSLEELEVG